MPLSTDAIMRRAPVIPVLVIDDLASAVPLGRALVAGGLDVLEITLRTEVALDAIRAIIAEVEGAVVGAGTVRTADQLALVAGLGCAFAVSPGFTPRLLDAAATSPCPLLPGAATATEMMQLAERGYDRQKFFPAVPAGGLAYLQAVASPLAEIAFCPTGGIDAASAPAFLRLGNVLCVGGSWVAPKAAVATGDWRTVTALAAEAARLPRG